MGMCINCKEIVLTQDMKYKQCKKCINDYGKEVALKKLHVYQNGTEKEKKENSIINDKILAVLLVLFIIALGYGMYLYITGSDERIKKSRDNEISLLLEKVNQISDEKPMSKIKIYDKLMKSVPVTNEYKETRKDIFNQYNKYRMDAELYGDKPSTSKIKVLAKYYLKDIMKEPDSLKIMNCTKPYKIIELGWLSSCSYRGKNSFGGYTNEVGKFIIRNNQIVSYR